MMLIAALAAFATTVGQSRVGRQHGMEKQAVSCKMQIALSSQPEDSSHDARTYNGHHAPEPISEHAMYIAGAGLTYTKTRDSRR